MVTRAGRAQTGRVNGMSTTTPRKTVARKTSARGLAVAARDEIRGVFERAEYDVEELADSRPGIKVGLARPSKGLVRAATYWEIWPNCPKQLKPALLRLETQRKRHDAERALGIVLGGGLPDNYSTDLDAQPVNVITRRRLYFELSGLADELRTQAKADKVSPGHPTNFIPRKVRTDDGKVIDATAHIDSWLADTKPSWLIIDGPASSGKNTLLAHLHQRAARSWVAHPQRVRPFVDATVYDEWLFREPAFEPDWVVCTSRISGPAFVVNEQGGKHRWLFAMLDRADTRRETRDMVGALTSLSFLSLEPLDQDQVLEWYSKRIPAPVYRRFTQVWELSPEFAKVASQLPHLAGIVQAASNTGKRATGKAVGKPTEPLPWLAGLMVQFLSSLKDELEEELDALDRGALEEFEHDHSRVLTALYEDLHSERVEDFLSERDDGVVAFDTPLIRDYFVARRLIAEVRAGNSDLLTRFRFPRKFIPLYLAVMAPDIAARAQIDESDEIQEDTATVEIKLDVETDGGTDDTTDDTTDVEFAYPSGFAGRLSRSAHGLRSNLQRMLRDPQVDKRYRREIDRIKKELDRLDALVHRARLWYEMPEPVEDSFPLRALITKIVAEQRKRFPRIPVALKVNADVVVSASREHLHEALGRLLENAMHAVAAVKPPMVEVRASYVGADRDTVRIDVIDNGPGVTDDARERIFAAHDDDNQQPGSGLQIARRYAAAMGAYVSLDKHAEKTCFYIELAAGRIAP